MTEVNLYPARPTTSEVVDMLGAFPTTAGLVDYARRLDVRAYPGVPRRCVIAGIAEQVAGPGITSVRVYPDGTPEHDYRGEVTFWAATPDGLGHRLHFELPFVANEVALEFDEERYPELIAGDYRGRNDGEEPLSA